VGIISIVVILHSVAVEAIDAIYMIAKALNITAKYHKEESTQIMVLILGVLGSIGIMSIIIICLTFEK